MAILRVADTLILTELAIEKTKWEPEAPPNAFANISCLTLEKEKTCKKNKKAQSETLSVADTLEK